MRKPMDHEHELNGISFVWDSSKAAMNLRKHGVAFERAAEAFFDPFFVLLDASSEGESRAAIIGMDERWSLLFVVHLGDEADRIRIVSARKATRNERRRYENQ